jgi:hypothetical protein
MGAAPPASEERAKTERMMGPRQKFTVVQYFKMPIIVDLLSWFGTNRTEIG